MHSDDVAPPGAWLVFDKGAEGFFKRKDSTHAFVYKPTA